MYRQFRDYVINPVQAASTVVSMARRDYIATGRLLPLRVAITDDSGCIKGPKAGAWTQRVLSEISCVNQTGFQIQFG